MIKINRKVGKSKGFIGNISFFINSTSLDSTFFVFFLLFSN